MKNLITIELAESGDKLFLNLNYLEYIYSNSYSAKEGLIGIKIKTRGSESSERFIITISEYEYLKRKLNEIMG